jgi:hypothetical protein
MTLSLAQMAVGTNKGVKIALDSIAAEVRMQGETTQRKKGGGRIESESKEVCEEMCGRS